MIKSSFQVYKSAGQEDSSIALMFLFSSLTSALFGSLLGILIVSLPSATCKVEIYQKHDHLNLNLNLDNNTSGPFADKYGRKKVAQERN